MFCLIIVVRYGTKTSTPYFYERFSTSDSDDSKTMLIFAIIMNCRHNWAIDRDYCFTVVIYFLKSWVKKLEKTKNIKN